MLSDAIARELSGLRSRLVEDRCPQDVAAHGCRTATALRSRACACGTDSRARRVPATVESFQQLKPRAARLRPPAFLGSVSVGCAQRWTPCPPGNPAMPSARQPPWMQEPADDEDGDDDVDELDPIGRNTLKLRSRSIVESIAVGASPPKLPPSNYSGQLSARGAGENVYRSNAYAQQPAPGGFSAEAARFMPATPQPYHPQHPPPYPRPSAYPTAQSSLGGGQHPPPLQQQQLPSMGQKRWEINDTMMHQSWGTHGFAPFLSNGRPSSTLHARSASALPSRVARFPPAQVRCCAR
jgi:hypothetical protein